MIDFQDVLNTQAILNKQHEQYLSIKGKDPQYRMEYRFSQRSKSWQYFLTIEDAIKFDYKRIVYGIFGNPVIERPLSSQLQKKGPRGGWSPYKEKKIKNEYLCSVCHQTPIDVENGFDTCDACAKKI